MKKLIDGFGKSVHVADGDVTKAIALLKDAGREFRVADDVLNNEAKLPKACQTEPDIPAKKGK